MRPTKIVIFGASGYTGAELLRLLLRHPGAEIVAVTSRTEAGKGLSEVFPRFRRVGRADQLRFVDPVATDISALGAEIAFLALPHGVAHEYAADLLGKGLRVIDLSADFRLRDAAIYQEYYEHPHPAPELLATAVYGLPEVYRDDIASASLVASPGCFPTSILLPLLPLLRSGKMLDASTIHVQSMSGVSGAGKKADTRLLFVECNESARAYGAPRHRHLSEIEQELSLAARQPVKISFTPHLIPVTAGICSTITADLSPDLACGAALEKTGELLSLAYADCPFVRLLGPGEFADTKNVVATTFIDIGWCVDPRTRRLQLFSAEDNLGKGAGGQAIQSFNLMTGRSETEGIL